MKAIFLILGIIAGILVVPVQAQTISEFGYQLHPEKLLENTEGVLQIFVTSNELMIPTQISNLKAISSDNSIVEILGIEDGNDKFIKNILVKAKKPGVTTLALAAQGFASKEITLKVFNNNNFPTQILMKITPEVFPIDGQKYGHVAIQLATTSGLPTLASENISIHLETPNKDTIKIKNSELLINSGEYYAITEFEIIGSGDAIIFAETEGMDKISGLVSILKITNPLQLQLSLFPKDLVSFSGTSGFAIIHLLDGEEKPVLAEKDIHFKLNVENPEAGLNISKDWDEVIFGDNDLVIKKGEYSTFTKFTPNPDLTHYDLGDIRTYDMFISAKDIVTKGDSFTILHQGQEGGGLVEGSGPSITKSFPFLTTGNEEIIAVTYFETETTVVVERELNRVLATTTIFVTDVRIPVVAKTDITIPFTSTLAGTVDPIDPIMKKGEHATIVYGKTSTVSSEEELIFYVTDDEGIKTVAGEAIGPIKDDLTLVVESMLPMILAEKEFPVLGYLVEASEEDEEVVDEDEDVDPRLGVTPFIEDSVLTFSANEFVEAGSVTIKQNQPYALMSMMSNELGTTNLSYQMGGFEGTTQIVSHTTDPAEIYLAFPKNILSESKTLATIQLLDSAANPVYAKKEIEINLVSNNEEVLKIPEELKITEGNYFTTFELEGVREGEIELAILSEDFSLSKYDINVVDITPELSLELLGGLNWNERIEAKLTVSIPEITTALDGFIVEWETDGGEVVAVEEITNREGIATINIIANDKATISVTAKVSGNGLSSVEISKTGTILNMPVLEVESISDSGILETEVLLDTYTMILIIIPVAVGVALFFLKRMDKLDMITEKIPIGDKIEEIKERISDIRNR